MHVSVGTTVYNTCIYICTERGIERERERASERGREGERERASGRVGDMHARTHQSTSASDTRRYRLSFTGLAVTSTQGVPREQRRMTADTTASLNA